MKISFTTTMWTLFIIASLAFSSFAQAPPVPIHPTPLVSAVGVGIDDYIEWTPVVGANAYWVRFDTSTAPTAPFIYDAVVSTTSFSFTHLMNDTDYCYVLWSSSDNGVNWGPASPIYTFRTITAKTPILNFPDNGHTGIALLASFSWNCTTSVAGIDFQVQIAEDNLFTVNPKASAWTSNLSLTLPDGVNIPALEQGKTYFWRVVSKNHASNTIISYSVVNWFTTTGVANAPVIGWPKSSPVPYSTLMYSNDVTVTWFVPEGSTGLTFKYRYSSNGGTNWLPSAAGAATSDLFAELLGLTPGTNYDFQVQSFNGNTSSAWTAESFRTNGIGTLVVPVPAWPVMVGADIPIIYSNSVDLTWSLNTSGGFGLFYEITYAPVSVVTPPGGAGWSTFTGTTALFAQIPVPLTNGVTYQWAVRSDNGAAQSGWSSVGKFTIFGNVADIKPILNFPIGGQELYTNRPTLNWQAGAPGATTFDVYYKIHTAGGFTQPASGQGLTNLSWTFDFDLPNGTAYDWFIVAHNSSNQSSSSDIETFSTVGAVGSLIPIIDSPTGDQLLFTNTPTLNWHVNGSSVNAIKYRVQIATEPAFAAGSIVYDTSGIVTLFYTVFAGNSQIVSGAKYYWRVQSLNPAASAWSNPVGTFITEAGNHPVVVLLGGLNNGAVVQTTSPTFGWYQPVQSKSALTYELQYATNKDFNNPAIVSDLTASIKTVTGLTAGSTYYWRVKSKTAGGETSAFSNIGQFIPSNATGIKPEGRVPVSFELAQNYPNPFNPSTSIKFGIPTAEKVTLRVFNVLGREVATLIKAEFKEAGTYNVSFDASHLSSGVYFYKLEAGKNVTAKKMLLLK